MIPLVAPTITEHDRMYLAKVSMWGELSHEHEVTEFEEEFADFVGCTGAVAVNSGTSALIVAMKAHFADRSTAIQIPSFSCRALLDAVYAIRNPAVLVDGHYDVPTAVYVAVESTYPYSVVAHMFGSEAVHSCEIEDITLSLGAVKAPQIGVCSFHRDKMMSTGRGGIIVSQDQELLDRCRELAYYDYPEVVTIDGQQTEYHYRPAFSFGMSALQAALGRSQLRQLPGFIERRREIAERYTEAFAEVGIECPRRNRDSVFFRYIIGVADPAGKVKALARYGIEAGRGVNPPLHRLLALNSDLFPGVEEAWSRLLSVPCHPSLTDAQVGFIIAKVLRTCV